MGLGVFGVPKVVKFVKKIDIDCSFASHQFTDNYLAAMLLPDLNCDFSYDKDGGSSSGNAGNKIIDKIVKNKNKVEYTNAAGSKFTWVEQHPKNIKRDIDNALNSSNVGKATEAKVADFVRKEKSVIGFGLKIERSNGNQAGDLDVVTKDEIIEVKASLNAIKGKEDQLDKYTDRSNINFLNPEEKEVILYINKPLKKLHPNDQKILERIRSKGVTIVNSLNALKEVLK